MFKHVPNILTVVRFILIPAIIISILNEQYITAFIILTISGLTDVLDGYIARKYNFITNFGKLIDPLADKATQVAILTTLAFKEIIPMWLIIIIFVKELVLIAGASFLYGKELVVSSKWFGKLATVLFYIAIVSSLFIRYFNITIAFDMILYYLALLMTIFSLIMYIITYFKNGYLKNLKEQK